MADHGGDDLEDNLEFRLEWSDQEEVENTATVENSHETNNVPKPSAETISSKTKKRKRQRERLKENKVCILIILL